MKPARRIRAPSLAQRGTSVRSAALLLAGALAGLIAGSASSAWALSVLALLAVGLTGLTAWRRFRTLRGHAEARARTEALLAASPVGLAFFDTELRCVQANPALALLDGHPLANHLGRRLSDVRPGLGAALEPGLRRALASGEPTLDVNLRLDAPGEPRHWFAHYIPVRDAQGRLQGVAAALVDMTERLLAERSRQESDERNATLVRAIPDALWGARSQAGALGDFFCTPALERLTGWSAEDFSSPSSDVALWLDMVHPEDKDRYRVLLEGLGPQAELSFEHRLVCADGRTRQVRTRVATSAADSRGDFLLACSVTDTTDRRIADALRHELHVSLKRSAVEWSETFDAVASPLVVLEADGRIQRLNHAARELLSHGRDVTGLPLEGLVSSGPWSQALCLVQSLGPQQPLASGQVHDSGQRRTWELTASLVEGSDVQGARIILVAQEVTRLLELQASLRRSETMAELGALVGGVAHEIKNPLFSISAVLDAWEATFGDASSMRPFRDVMRSEVRRINHLVQDLFEYGRPTEGERQEGLLEPVLAEAVDACALTAEQPGVAVVREGQASCRVSMDARRLFHVFRNLVENAVQHSPPGTQVRLFTSEAMVDGTLWVQCAVRDTGPGFLEEDLPHLFEPFFTRRRGGTGLGLSIVRRIVDEHQGSILLRNHPEGGAEALVRLPAVRASEEALRSGGQEDAVRARAG